MENQLQTNLPQFLSTYGNMFSYLQGHFDGLTSVERGRRFVKFACKLIPFTDVGLLFRQPELSKKESHDGGVDAIAKSRENNDLLCIQSKYIVSGVDEFDLILSKFKNYESNIGSDKQEPSLFGSFEKENNNEIIHFVIITASNLNTIIPKYTKSNRSSLSYFQQLSHEKRVHIIDGHKILTILQSAYRKLFVLPSNLDIKLEQNYLRMDGVYIGIISAPNLSQLYNNFGDALFLENIREYLGGQSGKKFSGGQRETVNNALIKTLETEPENFLARNNGITFRASKITPLDEKTLKLDDASIVNGCQTTMSVVKVPNKNSFVLIKIVEVQNSWDVAKAANFQNNISQIDLEIAQYIRPQKVRDVANQAGVSFDSDSYSAFDLLDDIYQDRINYASIRALFMGIFSRTPNNAIENNYTEIESNIIDDFYKSAKNDKVFEYLFSISKITQSSSKEIMEKLDAKDKIGDLFKRFWKDGNANYRTFLAILACCGCTNTNIYEHKTKRDYQNILQFLENVESKIHSTPKEFNRQFFNAFKVIGLEVMSADLERDKILQSMYRKIKTANFNTLFASLQLQDIDVN